MIGKNLTLSSSGIDFLIQPFHLFTHSCSALSWVSGKYRQYLKLFYASLYIWIKYTRFMIKFKTFFKTIFEELVNFCSFLCGWVIRFTPCMCSHSSLLPLPSHWVVTTWPVYLLSLLISGTMLFSFTTVSKTHNMWSVNIYWTNVEQLSWVTNNNSY